MQALSNCKYCNNTGYIDNVFIVGDLRQAEAMVVAHCLKRVGDPTLYNLFQDKNFDVHTWAASPIFSCIEDDVTKYQREIGKLSNHSCNYGAGPKVLQKKALKDGIKGVDYQFAKRIIETRHEQLPGLRKWWKDVERKLRTTRIITTCLGRRRIFFGRLDNATFRDGYADEPQSTVGDVCNIIFRRLYRTFLSWNNLDFFPAATSKSLRERFQPKPLIQIHDEVVVCCPKIKELIEYVIKSFYEAANIPLYICGEKEEPLVIPIELKIGMNWKDTEEIK